MASVFNRKNSDQFQVKLAVSGKEIKASIGIKDRKRAVKVGDKIQDLADLLKPEQKRTQQQLQRVIGLIFDAAEVPSPYDEPVGPSMRFKDFALTCLDKKDKKSTATYNGFKAAIESFVEIAGDAQLRAYTPIRVQEYQQALEAENYAPASIRVRMNFIRSIFKQALVLGLIKTNPTLAVESVKLVGVVDRGEFPQDAFDKIITFLKEIPFPNSTAWRTAMMISRYAGLRMRDAVAVRGCDLKEGDCPVLCYTARKTFRSVCVPIFEPLVTFLRGRAVTEQDHFCEGLHDKKANWLSETFSDIIKAAGIEPEKRAVASGRQFSTLTFHCLRHSFSTDLQRRGMPPHLMAFLTDHTTEKAADVYRHANAIEMASKLAQFFKS